MTTWNTGTKVILKGIKKKCPTLIQGQTMCTFLGGGEILCFGCVLFSVIRRTDAWLDSITFVCVLVLSSEEPASAEQEEEEEEAAAWPGAAEGVRGGRSRKRRQGEGARGGDWVHHRGAGDLRPQLHLLQENLWGLQGQRVWPLDGLTTVVTDADMMFFKWNDFRY